MSPVHGYGLAPLRGVGRDDRGAAEAVEEGMTTLADLDGLVEPAACRWLRARAEEVPPHQEIVELGSYTGQSSMWLATGACGASLRSGSGSHVTCVDVWDGPAWPGSVLPSEALVTFMRRRSELKLEPWLTPLRMSTVGVASMWVCPVGLMFIDADHDYDGVFADVEHWLPHLQTGGWLAMHDYGDVLPGPARVIDEILVPSGAFADISVIAGTGMWTGRLVRPW